MYAYLEQVGEDNDIDWVQLFVPIGAVLAFVMLGSAAWQRYV
jgi:hypothetical protein